MAQSGTAAGQLVTIGDVSLYVEVHGSGLPLVLLHGALGTIDTCFPQLLPRLAAGRKVVAVELQGHGHSPDIDRPLTYRDMANDVGGLIEALDLGQPDVVGYSLGGAVGLELTLRHPSLVRNLVYAGGTSYRRDGLHPEALDDGSSEEALEGSAWHQAYLRTSPHPDRWPVLVQKAADLDRTFQGWTADELRSVRTPTLLMIGDADIVRPEHTVEMFGLLGGGVIGDLVGLPPARLAVLPGTTHVGMIDRAQWMHSMIDDFLEGD